MLRNFPNSQPVDGQGREAYRREEEREGFFEGAAALTKAWESAELLLAQDAERKPVTVREAGYHSTEVFSLNTAMLKPHELHIVPLFMSSGSARGEISQ